MALHTLIVKRIRRQIIEASYKTKACHLGSALSCVDILVDLFFNRMKKDDLFIFSKASGAAALYAVLAEKGYFPKNKVVYYLKKYPLASKKVPGVLIDSGSLSHGLPQAIGMALVLKKDKKKGRVFCLMSDAECQEGTFWESLLFIKQHKIKNLEIYIDWNKFQACGKIKDILDIPWDFVKSYGIKVIDTIKGKGISFCEGNNEWHYKNLTPELYKKAMEELK